MADKIISITNIRDLIDEEIAKFASRASSDDGGLLYDSLVNYSKDTDEIERAIKDAMSAEMSAMTDIVSGASYSDGTAMFSLHLPDHPDDWNNETEDLGRVIACDVITMWFKKRGHDSYMEVMGTSRDSALSRLSHNLYRRKPISRDQI